MRSLFHNKYFLVVNAISIMVALLIHSPEMMDLSNLSGEAALSPTVVEQRRLSPALSGPMSSTRSPSPTSRCCSCFT